MASSATGKAPGFGRGAITELNGGMLAALAFALAAHLLLLLGVGFELPDPAPPPVRTLEVMTVEQPASVAAPPENDAVRAQVDRSGETNIPLPDLPPGTISDAAPLPANLPEPVDPEPANEPTDASEPLPESAPVRGPDQLGNPAPAPLAAPSPLLTPTAETMAEILTGLNADMSLPSMSSAAPTAKSAPDASAADVFASRSAEIAALTARIGARDETRAGRQRRKAISTRTKEYRYASYMEAWRRKVERIGNLNYPQAAKELGLYGSLILHVAVRADGNLEGVRVARSSGHDVLDQAAVDIVKLAAPFAPFPDSIKAETDVLDITRVWQFQRDHRLGWDN